MVQKSGRPRGRPRKFDDHVACERATHVFWAKGYDGVTIDDLVDAMGVARPSFYAVFGDKPTLFLRCLKEYGDRTGALAMRALSDPPHIVGALRGFLSHAVHNATGDDSPAGCLIVCIAPLVDDQEVRDYLVRAGKLTEEAVERRLRLGIEARELPKDFPVRQRARLAIDVSRGLSMRARIGGSRVVLLRDAVEAAALITT